MTLAAHLLPIEAILAVYLPVNMALSAYLAVRHHRTIAWRTLGAGVLPWMGAGVALGVGVARLSTASWLKALFALFVVALAAVELWRLRRPGDAAPPLGRAARGLVLAAAGLVHGLFACGGPMAVYVMGREVPDKGAFRSTLAALWLVLNAALIASYASAGHITGSTLLAGATLLLPLALGIAAGEHIHASLSPRRFRIAVFALLLAAGASLLARSAVE